MAGFVLSAGAAPAWAQTASQITPPDYAPPTVQPRPPIVLPQSSASSIPPGAEALDIRLGAVMIDGATVDPETIAALRSRLIGKTIKIAEIFAAARELETQLARGGRVLTRVVVPAQDLVDGATLRLTIVDGFIERVDTSNLPLPVRARVARLLAPLSGARGIGMAQIERRLLLASDVPGVSLRSTLAAGSTPGASVLVVDGQHRLVTAFVTFDNMLSSALGRVSFGLGLNVNSGFGLGEAIYLRASGLPTLGDDVSVFDSTPRNRALAGGVLLPLGDDGLLLNLEATDARTAPRHAAAAPGSGSKFQRLSGRLSYPFLRTRALTLSGEASLDFQDERVSIISPVVLPLSFDRLRVARIAGSALAILPHEGVLSARIEGSVGIDGLGARSADDATALLPLSRAGADAAFEKLALTLSLDQPLAPHLTLALRGMAQTGFGAPLVNAEQIGIATTDAMSALSSGTVQGDAGYAARAEFRAPFVIRSNTGLAQVAPYVFGAFGSVRFEQPSAVERRETNARAYGLGLRLTAQARDGSPGVSAGVEYGRARLSGDKRESDRLSFTIATRF